MYPLYVPGEGPYNDMFEVAGEYVKDPFVKLGVAEIYPNAANASRVLKDGDLAILIGTTGWSFQSSSDESSSSPELEPSVEEYPDPLEFRCESR